jgi:hypothetical protein
VSTVFFSIGNSDDRLTQAGWSAFLDDVRAAVRLVELTDGIVHFAGHSYPDGPCQNAMWCIQLSANDHGAALKSRLTELARRYRQDSIAWAVVDQVELVPSASGVPR